MIRQPVLREKRWSGPVVSIAVLFAFLLVGCDQRGQPIVGNYVFHGEARAVLNLFDNSKYEFCLGKDCEVSTYEVEPRDNAKTVIYFSGAKLKGFGGGGGIASIQYWGLSCPCINFGDPDSPDRFEKT